MGNNSLRRLSCISGGSHGGFSPASTNQSEEETLIDTVEVTDVHVLNGPPNDQHTVTPINISPRLDDEDIRPSHSNPRVIHYPEPQYVLPGSVDYGMVPNSEDTTEEEPLENVALSLSSQDTSSNSDTDRNRSFHAFPHGLRSCLKRSQKNPKTSGHSSKSPSKTKPKQQKRVTFNLAITTVAPAYISPSESICSMDDDFSLSGSSTIVERRSSLDSTDSGSKEISRWRQQFSPPAADYVCFRNRLRTLFVSLENVWVSESYILGTIKTQHLGNRGTVFIRCTYDAWQTYVDVQATSTPSIFPTQYVTYHFEVSMPVPIVDAMRIMFAVCLTVGSKEYWDNNDGLNYELVFDPRT